MSTEANENQPVNGLKGLLLGAAAVFALIYLPGKLFGGDAMMFLAIALGAAVVGMFTAVLARAHMRLRIGILLAWAFPGLGHIYLGEKQRGLLFATILPVFFLIGLFLSDWAAISPFERHPIWGMAQLPGGLMTLLAYFGTLNVKIMSANDTYLIGSVYVGASCLMNVLAMCDIWDRHRQPSVSSSPPAETV